MDQTYIYTSGAATAATAPVHADTAAAKLVRSRIAVIDVMRGLIMLIMLFDHVRETIYLHMQVGDPMDVTTTAPELFFTRMAAHFCAPVFPSRHTSWSPS